MPAYVVNRSPNTGARGNSSFLPSLNANWKQFLGPNRDATAQELGLYHASESHDNEDMRTVKAGRRHAAIISSSDTPFSRGDNVNAHVTRSRSHSRSPQVVPTQVHRSVSNASPRPPVGGGVGRTLSLNIPLTNGPPRSRAFHPGGHGTSLGTDLASPRTIANSFIASQHIRNAMAEEERSGVPVAVSEAAGEAAKRELARMGVRRRSGPGMGSLKGKEKENLRPQMDDRRRDRMDSHSSTQSYANSSQHPLARGAHASAVDTTTMDSEASTASQNRQGFVSTSTRGTATRSGIGAHIPHSEYPAHIQVRSRTSSARAGPPISPSGLIGIGNTRVHGHGYGNSRQRTSSSTSTLDRFAGVHGSVVVGTGGRRRSDTTSTTNSTNSMATFQSTAALLRSGSERERGRYTPSPSPTPVTGRLAPSSASHLQAGLSSGGEKYLSAPDVQSRHSRTSGSQTLVRHSSEASQENMSSIGHEGSLNTAVSASETFAGTTTVRARHPRILALEGEDTSGPRLSRRSKLNASTVNTQNKAKYLSATERKPLRRRLVLVWKKVSSATRSVVRVVRKARERMGMGGKERKSRSARRIGGDEGGKSGRGKGRSKSRTRARARARKDGISQPRPQTVASIGSNASSLPAGFELVDPSNPNANASSSANANGSNQPQQQQGSRWSKRFSAPRFIRRSNGVIEMENYPGAFVPVREGEGSWRGMRRKLKEKLDREKEEKERRRLIGDESPMLSPLDSPVPRSYL